MYQSLLWAGLFVNGYWHILLRRQNPSRRPYPNNRLGDAELQALSDFMNGGGGPFATGDHGYLRMYLSGSALRARSMRLCGDTDIVAIGNFKSDRQSLIALADDVGLHMLRYTHMYSYQTCSYDLFAG
jgi:hypothetical protein